MKNADIPAMPTSPNSSDPEWAAARTGGLTKREHFAAMFMAAWITHHGTAGGYGYSSQVSAKSAIEDADALLEELAK